MPQEYVEEALQYRTALALSNDETDKLYFQPKPMKPEPRTTRGNIGIGLDAGWKPYTHSFDDPGIRVAPTRGCG